MNVLTQHNNIGRTGQNTNESILTPQNVNSAQFGLLFSLPVDGQVYAQPLYLSGVNISGSGTHNAVFVATEHDSVYAFDADSNGGAGQAPLWKASLLTAAYGAAPGATTVSSQVIAQDIIPEYGITGTPVIDPVKGVLYVVSFTQEGTSYVLRLHALSVANGLEMPGSPVAIQAQIPGTGTGSKNGILTLDSRWENQRNGLLLLNGVLYIGLASHADNGDWHGWVLSYSASTLQQLSAYCTSPNGMGSGIWGGGDGLAADVIDPVGHPFGRLFVPTGNGDYTAQLPYGIGMDYGDSIIGLDLTNGAISVRDEFTPSNQATLNSSDGDLGSGGVMVLPDQPGANTHLLAQEGKSGTLFLINRDSMGGYHATDAIVQEVSSAPMQSGIWGGPAYWNGNLYTGEKNQPIKAYSVANGLLSPSPSSVSPDTYSYPGPSPSVSSSGTSNGILWALETDTYNTESPAVLKAYDATNLGNELYASNQSPVRDSAGPAVKYNVPTIVNGKVYVGATGEVDVYGLFALQQQIATPVINPGTTSFTTPIQVTITDATPGAVIHYTVDGSSPGVNSPIYTGPVTVNYTETIAAIATAPGYVWLSPVSATFTSLNNTANPVISPAGGTFSSSPAVTITDNSPGAIIYYTTDGSMPSTASPRYNGPFTITGSATIEAFAIAPGLSGSALISQTYTTQSQVDFSQGFTNAQSFMTFNGTTVLDDSRLQLTAGYTNDTGSAFVTAPLNIQAFVTDFLFQLSNPQADGITFTIQSERPTELGPYSANLGYSGIGRSLAVKFDFYNDAGEGPDSTGVYINGAIPSIPAIDLRSSGVNLGSGDTMGAHITYDGTNLAVTIKDQVSGATWSGVWQENIPQIVNGNTAYIGFTGSAQILTASQKIATWTYRALTPGQLSSTSTPVISPAAGSYQKAQVVSLSDATPQAIIYYTTDGTPATTSSSRYTAPFTVTMSQTISTIALVPGGAVSGTTAATFAIASGANNAVPTYTTANGGFSYGSMILNGATFVANAIKINGRTTTTKSLQLTDNGLNEIRSAYFSNPVNVQSFSTDFDFQLLNSNAEGFTFVLQNMGLNALGTGLGYGVGPQGTGPSITNSIAVKFDTYNTSGEGSDSVGLYVNGASPTLPANDLTPTGLQLKSGHVFHAHISYDGTTLVLTLLDATTNVTAAASYKVNIPAAVGANVAYAGFTAATHRNASASENILDWTYVATPLTLPATPAPTINPNGGSYHGSATATLTDSMGGSTIYYTLDGSTPTTNSQVYVKPLQITSSQTVQAIALGSGMTTSSVSSATFTITAPYNIDFSGGFSQAVSSGQLQLNGSAALAGTSLQLTDGGLKEKASAFYTVPMSVRAFSTSFTLQLTNATADGMTFTIQNVGPGVIGMSASSLGFGNLKKSVAVKFDLHNNAGEGPNSTGVYLNGAMPTVPATSLAGTGIDLHSGDPLNAAIAYDGTTLTLTLTDLVTQTTWVKQFPVDIPGTIGGTTAYVGFTAGTGGSSAVQDVVSWTFIAGQPGS